MISSLINMSDADVYVVNKKNNAIYKMPNGKSTVTITQNYNAAAEWSLYIDGFTPVEITKLDQTTSLSEDDVLNFIRREM